MTRTLDIYTRVSQKTDARQRSLEGQEIDCRARVTAVGAETGEVHRDPARSAWNPKTERPGWEALMLRLEAGDADGVVVFDLARFARRPADGERLISAAERGLVILDAGTEYNLQSASGRKAFRDAMTAAAFYSDEISERTRRGKRIKAMAGEVDRRRSFGFEPDGVTVREAEADIIRDHARRLLAGEPQDALIRELREQGVPTVRGAVWGYTTYRQLMERPRNAGLIQHNGAVVEGVRLPGPAILDDDTYHRLRALYAARRTGRQPTGRYACTGFVFCGRCDAPLGGRPVSGTPRRHYWCKQCRRLSVDAARLDDWVGDWAVRELSDPAHADAVAAAEAEAADARRKLETELAAIEADALAIADRFGRGELSLARYDAMTVPLDKRIGKLRADLDGLAAAEPLPAAVRTIPARDQAWLGWLATWADGTAGERRAMLSRALGGRRIVVGPGKAAKFDSSRVTVA